MASGPLTGANSRGNRLWHGGDRTFSRNRRDSDDDGLPKRTETDDSCSHNRGPVNGREVGNLKLENLVRVSLDCSSKVGAEELRRRLVGELDRVRSLVKRIESIDFGNGITGSSQYSANDESKVGSTMPPEASQCHRNSVKERFPMVESNKKLKKNGGKRDGAEMGDKKLSKLFSSSSQLFKSCSNLLTKLMKHKHGWVFNKPVDVKGLQLHDYYTIVKRPMDLGTVKSRLNKNWYKSAEEFAEDVRLTFRNAMLYNPKGQDVHVMAEILLNLFEENWAGIEAQYKLNRRSEMGRDANLPTPSSRKVSASSPAPAPVPVAPPARAPSPPPQSNVLLPPATEMRTLDRAESMTKPADPKPKPASVGHSGRMPAPKKPKAKDPDKRDMTLEEKQKLSINLQDLPSEKLGAIVEIIKKRHPSLCQQDDEIEVDIDAVDPETLWELDRFVTNYKKGLSKKRKAEHAIHGSAEAGHTILEDLAPVTAASPKQTEMAEPNVASSSPGQLEKASPSPVQLEKGSLSPVQVEKAFSPVLVEKQGENASGSSSSSSSSSHSGSSSSDSDSDSSSAYGSDAGH